jgi:hypothetical protein
MAFELSPITDDPGQTPDDNSAAATIPRNPNEIAEMMTPDGTAHPDDIGQVPVESEDQSSDPSDKTVPK